MRRFTAVIAVWAAFLILATTAAFAEPGKPIDGTDVGLDHQPPTPPQIVARGATSGEGNVTFNNLKPGLYTFVLLDTSTLKVPCRVLVTFNKGAKLPLSEPILPGKRGSQGYAVDKSGRKLTVVLEGTGGSITVHVQTDK